MCKSFDPAIPVQEIYPKEIIQKVSKDVCTGVFDYSIQCDKKLEVLNVYQYEIG